jgi:hypothetical protein
VTEVAPESIGANLHKVIFSGVPVNHLHLSGHVRGQTPLSCGGRDLEC